jgi:chitodextrinase
MKVIILLIFCMVTTINLCALSPEESAVLVTASVQANPPQIKLSWKPYSGDGNYSIYKHSNGPNANWGSAIATLPATASEFIDTDVQEGIVYEYHIVRGSEGDGYIASGINVPMIDDRGTVLFVVDNSFALSLAAELRLMHKMMLADGWDVVRIDVDRHATVESVKRMIETAYFNDPDNVKAVYLFGHVPVPYSGNIVPDGHDGARGNNHRGAWAADVFYGDINSSWTDHSVNVSISNFAHNFNVPGDGKYDQSFLSEKVELQVGRVDLQDMTWFDLSEEALLKQYVMKNYKFRYKTYVPEQRAIIYSGFGKQNGMYPAKSAYRNAANFVGYENITNITAGNTILPRAQNESYLFAHGDGSGWMQGSSGFGMTDEFAAYDPKCTFWSSFGSWYGDWDYQNNFLRAPLATSYGLFNAWVGATHWYLHHFAMGYNIGYSVNLWHNNQQGNLLYPQTTKNNLSQNVEIALMGDPTLRLHPAEPPKNVMNSSGVITWEASSDEEVLGYHVYKASSELGNYTRLTADLTKALNFVDVDNSPRDVYMVRAVKLEVGKSGSYYNPSQGMFSTGLIDSVPPTIVQNIVVSNITDRSAIVAWAASSDNVEVLAYHIFNGSEQIASTSANSIILNGLLPGTIYNQLFIVAVDPSGNESVPANIEKFVSSGPPDSEPPSIPDGLMVKAANTNSAEIAWSLSDDNIGVKEYRVFLNGILYKLTQNNALSITGLRPNTTYSIEVVAVDGSGNSSARSKPLQFMTNNMPISFAPVAYMNTPPNIDGKVDPLWDTIDKIAIQNSRGEITDVGDFYASFRVGWDEKNLYFILEAQDDEFMNHAGTILKNDNVELFFDMGNQRNGSSSSGASSGDNKQLRFIPLFQFMVLDDKTIAWQTVNWRSVATDGYWTIEAAIPWSVLGGNVTIAEGLKIGFDIKVADYDRDGSNAELRWSSITTDPVADDREFGELQLLSGAALDITAPSAPANLRFSNEQTGMVRLSWDQSIDNVGVANYEVYRENVLMGVTENTNIDISGLSAGIVTGFYVVAIDVNNNKSIASPIFNYGSTSIDNISPTPPSGLRTTNINDTSLHVFWLESVDNVKVAGYSVSVNGVLYATETLTSIFINGLSPSTEYIIQVQAFDDSSNVSPWSSITVRTLAAIDREAPSIPDNLRVSKTTSRGVVIEWDAATDNVGVTAYNIYLDRVELLKTVTGTATLLTTLHIGENYQLSVSALDAAGNESAQCEMISITPTPSLNYTNPKILIYPNPAKDSINIRNEAPGESQIDVFSVNGQLVHSLKTTNKNDIIDVRNFENGEYIFLITNANTSLSYKILIKK